MNVSAAYTWKTDGCSKCDNNPLLPSNIRGLLIGKSNCGKTTLLLNLLLQPHWLDYNHLSVFGKSLHQQEYQILKSGYEAGLSKSQVTNIFHNQEVLVILFPQDAKNLMHIHDDHCDDDMSLQQFKDYCGKVWNGANHNFVTIDLTSGKMNVTYRKNLDCFYLPVGMS